MQQRPHQIAGQILGDRLLVERGDHLPALLDRGDVLQRLRRGVVLRVDAERLGIGGERRAAVAQAL